MRRSVALLMLMLRFGRAVLVSGVETIAVILKTGRPGAAPPPVALVRVRFAPLSERGAAVLGGMVSLTPGTTTIDIDTERCELLLHVLDASDTDALVNGIRREFEPGLRILFGTEGRA